MKKIRGLMIPILVVLAFLALAATGARAQTLAFTSFNGTFTLPLDAQWGAMALPAGDYILSYGQPSKGGFQAVTVAGKADGSPRGTILAGPRNNASAANNTLLCIREGDILYVRALELPAIGESIQFALPHGASVKAWIVSERQNHSKNTQLAQAPMLIQRIPVKPSAK